MFNTIKQIVYTVYIQCNIQTEMFTRPRNTQYSSIFPEQRTFHSSNLCSQIVDKTDAKEDRYAAAMYSTRLFECGPQAKGLENSSDVFHEIV